MKIPIDNFADWLKNKNLKETTIEEYLYYLNKFMPYDSFSQESINKFLSKKDNRNIVARSLLSNLQKYLTVNYKELGLSRDERMEISEVEMPKISGRPKQKMINPLMQDQIHLIEKYLVDEKEKLMLLMSYYGGLRVGELLKIKISSFNWETWKKNMTEIGECRVLGKGDKEGIALFPPELMKRVARYIRKKQFPSLASYIFLNRKVGLDKINFQNRSNSWRRKLATAGLKAGIVKLDEFGKVIEETKVHPHKLRHSWGYYLRNIKKMDTMDIKEVLRHESIVSTQRYIAVDKEHLKKVLNEPS